MAYGKIRHPNHVIDSKAIQFIQNILPSEWVVRQMHPDYGIDLDLELFAYEGENCVTLGEHIFLQVKGTEHAQYSKITPFGKTLNETQVDSTIDVLKYPIDVSLLKLVERMGSSIPVLLVVVDLVIGQAYQICLNDYIRYVLPEQNPKFREQKTVTIYIPKENFIFDHIFLWYGKRAKMYALFQEIFAVTDDCTYSEGIELITKVQQLLNRIRTHDAWNARTHFRYMDFQYAKLTEMCNCDLITDDSKVFVQHAAGDPFHWKDAILYVGLEERPVTGFDYAQEISCRRFLEAASGMASYYENVLRRLGLPTTNFRLLQA